MSNNKVKNSIWFTGMGGTIGIVFTVNEVGTRKAYIKTVTGIDQKQDEREIADYGSPVTEGHANLILRHLSENEK